MKPGLRAPVIRLCGVLLLAALAFSTSGCLFWRKPSSSSSTTGRWARDDRLLAEHVPSQVVVRLEPGVDIEIIAKSVGARPVKQHRALNAWLLDLPAGLSVGETANKLAKMKGVRYAEPNHIYHLTDFPSSGVPSDASYSLQAQALNEIKAPQAWAVLKEKIGDPLGDGDPGIVIAVVDSGVDHKHPDFSSQGFPGGWKVLPGYNAVDGNADPADAEAEWYTDPAGYDETHGTHVAGIAAARVNDGRGVAGVAGGVRLLPIKAFVGDWGTDFDIACGIRWAADYSPPSGLGIGSAKVRVINLSLGGVGYAQVLQDAITYAVDKGAVPVAAMGNDYKGVVSYPAAMQGVIAVGAVDGFEQKADFSTTGSHISLSAPGVDIYSDLFLGSGSHAYGRLSGTSMATPFVSGAVALVLSRWPELRDLADPRLVASRVKSHLEATAHQPDGAAYPNPETGAGTLDVYKAVTVDPATTATNGRLTVNVYSQTDTDHSPVWAADVIVVAGITPNQRTVATGRTDSSGRAIFYLPSGTYTVYASTSNFNSQGIPAYVDASETAAVDIPIDFGERDTLTVDMTPSDSSMELDVTEPGSLRFDSSLDIETTNGGFFYTTSPSSSVTYKLKGDHQASDTGLYGDSYSFGLGYAFMDPPLATITAIRTGNIPGGATDGTNVGKALIQNDETSGAFTAKITWEGNAAVHLVIVEPGEMMVGSDGVGGTVQQSPGVWKSPHGTFTVATNSEEYQLDAAPPVGSYKILVKVESLGTIPMTLTLTRKWDAPPSLDSWNGANLLTIKILH